MGLFDLGRKLQAETGFDEEIEFLRDGLSCGVCPAKVGQSTLAWQDYGGAAMKIHRVDFIFKASDVNIGRPDVRDVIVWNQKRYAVCDTDYEACWRWHDRAQTTYRVHAEEVDSEQAN